MEIWITRVWEMAAENYEFMVKWLELTKYVINQRVDFVTNLKMAI